MNVLLKVTLLAALLELCEACTYGSCGYGWWNLWYIWFGIILLIMLCCGAGGAYYRRRRYAQLAGTQTVYTTGQPMTSATNPNVMHPYVPTAGYVPPAGPPAGGQVFMPPAYSSVAPPGYENKGYNETPSFPPPAYSQATADTPSTQLPTQTDQPASQP